MVQQQLVRARPMAAKAVEKPRTPAPARTPAPRAPASIAVPQRFIADPRTLESSDPLAADLLDSFAEIKALVVREPTPVAKPYAKADLQAIAEIAYHYLFAGAHSVASVLYEGVAALAPDDANFALGVGLCADKLGDKQKARASYARAAALDPGDPRAELNLAELLLEEDQPAAAKQHLARAVKKADARNERALSEKARAIYRHLPRS